MRFDRVYFVISIVLFLIEVVIACFVRDRFVRPYLGDFLVVILVYTVVRTFFDWPKPVTAMAVLAFAFLVEWSQYFRLVDFLGLEQSRIARTVLGTSFDWEDLLAYCLGVLVAYGLDRRFRPDPAKH